MQSGVTGMNTLRIYSPIKQVEDQDPQGQFIRQWVPELSDVPDEYLAQPWAMGPLLQPGYGCVLGSDYPEPVVDHKVAVAAAKEQIAAIRKLPETRAQAQEVIRKHGSRRRAPAARRKKKSQ